MQKASMSQIMQNEDISREGLTLAKLQQPLRLIHAPNSHAIAKLSSFQKFNLARINALLGTDFQGVILDVDECIAPHHGRIDLANFDKIMEMVEEGLHFVIHSNMKANDRYDEILESGKGSIALLKSRYPKPDPRGFDECVDLLKLPRDKVIAVGDNFLTDGGAIQVGIPFVHIDPIRGNIIQQMARAYQVIPRDLAAYVSDFYDFTTDRKVLRDEDMENV